jgi:hypothetical protein
MTDVHLSYGHPFDRDSWFVEGRIIPVEPISTFDKINETLRLFAFPTQIVSALSCLREERRIRDQFQPLSRVLEICMCFNMPRVTKEDWKRLPRLFGIPKNLDGLDVTFSINDFPIISVFEPGGSNDVLTPDIEGKTPPHVYIWLHQLLEKLFEWWKHTIILNQGNSNMRGLGSNNFNAFLNTIHAVFVKNLKVPTCFMTYISRTLQLQTFEPAGNILLPIQLWHAFIRYGQPVTFIPVGGLCYFVSHWLHDKHASVLREYDGSMTSPSELPLQPMMNGRSPRLLQSMEDTFKYAWLRRLHTLSNQAKRILKIVQIRNLIFPKVSQMPRMNLFIEFLALVNQHMWYPIGPIPTVRFEFGGQMFRRLTIHAEHLLTQPLVQLRPLLMKYEDNFTIDFIDFIVNIGSPNTVELWSMLQTITPLINILLRIFIPNTLYGFTLSNKFLLEIPDLQRLRTCVWSDIPPSKPQNDEEAARFYEILQKCALYAENRVLSLRQLCLLLGIITEINEIYTVLFRSRAVATILDNLRYYFEWATDHISADEEMPVSDTLVIEPSVFQQAYILFTSESAIIGQSARVLTELQQPYLTHPNLNGTNAAILEDVWNYSIFLAAFAVFPFLMNITRKGYDYTMYAPVSQEMIDQKKQSDRNENSRAELEWLDDINRDQEERERGTSYDPKDDSRDMGTVWVDGNRPYPTTRLTFMDSHGSPDDFVSLERVDRTTH